MSDVLTDKSYKNTTKISRYGIIPYYYHNIDNKYIMGTDSWLKDTTAYTNYIVKHMDTYDSLALKFYNNPTMYWVICSFNHITDPFDEPKEGSILKIPSISTIEFDLNGRN